MVKILDFPIPEKPTILSNERANFRINFIKEELTELEKACTENNLDEATDALIDLIYVAAGALVEMGIPYNPCFDAVHNANMQKIRGSLEKRPNSLGYDAVKPNSWLAPSHLPFFNVTTEEILNILKNRQKEKIIILGHARHGKDTVCEYLRDKYNFKFQSSSMFALENIIWPVLKDEYNTKLECFADRVNNRELWFDLITNFNASGLKSMGELIFEENDIYCGLRQIDELNNLIDKKIVKIENIYFVDRSKILSIESENSSEINIDTINNIKIIDNNSSLEDLYKKLDIIFGETNDVF